MQRNKGPPSEIRRRAKAEKGPVADQPSSLTLIRAPEACYDDIALFYFTRRFVTPDGGDGFPGHLTFLPGLFDHHNRGLLEIATLSVAQMATYNQFGGDEFRLQSYKNYGKAIRMLQDIIRSEDQVTDDKVIMSILLLCTLKVRGHANMVWEEERTHPLAGH